MPVKTITAEIDGKVRKIKADIPDDATPDEIEGAVHQFLSTETQAKPQQQEYGIEAIPEPKGIGESIARWTDNVKHDLMHGTDLTGVGTVLKKMGAHGLAYGNNEKVAEFMGSMPLGLLQFVKGHAQLPDQPITGAGNIIGGTLKATEIPSAFMAPEAAPAVAEGASKLGTAATKLLPSAERAGQKFEQVAAAVGDKPVNLYKAAEPIFEALKLERTGGGTPPSVITKLAERLPEHGGVPVPFSESRLFQSNAGRLSASEMMGAKPQMQRQVSRLAKALSEENERMATEAGVGDVYREAMKEYRNYMRLKDFKGNAAEYAKKAAITGLLGTGAYRLYKMAGE